MWFFFQWCAWLCDPQYFFYITVQILKTLCFPLLRQGPQSHSFNFTDFFLFVFFVYFIWMSCSLVDGLVNKKKNYLWTLSHFRNRTSVFNITFQTKFVKCPHIIPLKNKKKLYEQITIFWPKERLINTFSLHLYHLFVMSCLSWYIHILLSFKWRQTIKQKPYSHENSGEKRRFWKKSGDIRGN